MTAVELAYPIFVFSTLILALIMIPRELFREYLMYGFLIGGLGDVFNVTLLQNILGIISFKNQGIFYVLGHHALSPLGWTLAVMLFLYFIPRRRVFLFLYVISWGLMALGFAYIVNNIGLFDFQSWFYPLPAWIIFTAWFAAAAWLFCKTSSHAPDFE